MELSENVTSYYLTNRISVLNAMLPPSLRPAKVKCAKDCNASFNPEFTDFDKLTDKQSSLLSEIMTHGSVFTNFKNRTQIMQLLNKGAVIVEEIENTDYATKIIRVKIHMN